MDLPEKHGIVGIAMVKSARDQAAGSFRLPEEAFFSTLFIGGQILARSWPFPRAQRSHQGVLNPQHECCVI